MSDACCDSKEDKAKRQKQEEEWQAGLDLSSILRYNEIRKDTKRWARAKAKAKEQLATLQSATK